MMAKNMKMRARFNDGITTVKVLMHHPMETGRRKTDDDVTIPAHFVQVVTVKLNDQVVMESQWGTGISKNPYLTFKLTNAKVGDTVSVAWEDNKGEQSESSIAVT
jgi:sulfur-oxidizing protein SoxZ